MKKKCMCFVTTLTTQTGGTNNNKFRFYTKNFNNYDLINKGEITLLILNNYPNYYLNQLFFISYHNYLSFFTNLKVWLINKPNSTLLKLSLKTSRAIKICFSLIYLSYEPILNEF